MRAAIFGSALPPEDMLDILSLEGLFIIAASLACGLWFMWKVRLAPQSMNSPRVREQTGSFMFIEPVKNDARKRLFQPGVADASLYSRASHWEKKANVEAGLSALTEEQVPQPHNCR